MSQQQQQPPASTQYGQGQQSMQQGRVGQQPQQQQQPQSQLQPQGQSQPQPQMQMQGQTQIQGQQQGRGPGMMFEDHLTNELRIALEDFNDVTHVAEWCAVRCAREGPQLADCARVCEDIAELAELNEKLIARDSMFGPEIAETFVRVAQQGLPEIQQHQQAHPHVTETISVINRAIDSCNTLLQMGTRPTQQMGTRTGMETQPSQQAMPQRSQQGTEHGFQQQ